MSNAAFDLGGIRRVPEPPASRAELAVLSGAIGDRTHRRISE
jgi:hypothetical protein